MASQKMIATTPETKSLFEETRELIEEQDGHKPTQDQAVKMACEALQEVRCA